MKHETPTMEIFNELKDASTAVWNTKDNTYGYVTEKLERVNSITNYADNVMVCYRMFDSDNQRLMREKLSDKSLHYIDNNL
jgi:hypothetical protein